MKEISLWGDSEFLDQMTYVYHLLYSRNSTERVKLNISFVIFKCISRHFRGIKITIFRRSMPLTPLSLAPPVENLLRGPCITIGVRAWGGGGGRGGCKVWATQIFWAEREIWAKPVFKEVSMLFFFEEIDIFYFNLESAW